MPLSRFMLNFGHVTYNHWVKCLSICPIVWLTVGAQQMIWQSALSNFLDPPSLSLYHSLASLSILGCCLPIFSSACLAFCLLALCLARLFWQVLMIVRHGRTTSVLFSSQWPEDLHYGPVVCLITFCTSSLVTWSLYVIPRIFLKHLISVACILVKKARSKAIMFCTVQTKLRY